MEILTAEEVAALLKVSKWPRQRPRTFAKLFGGHIRRRKNQ